MNLKFVFLKKIFLFLFLNVIFFFSAASFLQAQTKVNWDDFYSRPLPEQRALREAAQEQGLELEEFLALIEPNVSPSLNITTLWLIFSSTISLGSFIAVIIIWRRQKVVEKVLVSSQLQRDRVRRLHLQRFYKFLQKYYREHGRYPSPTEFEVLREKNFPLILDPLEGQERPEGGRFSYYYTQKPRGSLQEDQNYFRLWCFLESKNKEDKEQLFVLEAPLKKKGE